MMTSITPNTAYFLRLPTVQIAGNKNHCYLVLATLMEYNRNNVGTSCLSFGQAYEFLGLRLRKDCAVWEELMVAYRQMIDQGYIRSIPPKEIEFDSLIEMEILPAFYEGGFCKLSVVDYQKIWNLQIPSKEKFFHVYLYQKAFAKFNPPVSRIAKTTGISRNTVYRICEQIEKNEL